MAKISEDEARELFKDHAATIVEMALDAWGDWMAFPHRATWQCRRSRANFVWEQLTQRANVYFQDDPRVVPLRRHESFLYLMDDRVVFRFKKSDETGMTSNIPTQEQLALADPQQDLAGLDDVARVAIVYTLNKLETAIADVAVVARDNGSIEWKFSLRELADVVAMPVVQRTPAPSGDRGERVTKSLVTPKGNERKSEADVDGDV